MKVDKSAGPDWKVANISEGQQGQIRELQVNEPNISVGKYVERILIRQDMDLPAFGKARTDWEQPRWLCLWEIMS